MSELYHYGIPGMKWGVKRFQSSSGKYTSTGRKKYISNRTKAIQKDIDSFKPYTKTGMKSKNGKTLLSAKEVKDIVKGLEGVKSKTAKKAGVKYDKVAKKTNDRLADNDKRVKEWGAGQVKFANKAHMAVYTATGLSVARSILKSGAANLRVMKNSPGVTQGEIKAKAALTLIGMGAVVGTTAYINKRLHQDIVDTNNYEKRQSTKKKKRKK